MKVVTWTAIIPTSFDIYINKKISLEKAKHQANSKLETILTVLLYMTNETEWGDREYMMNWEVD